MTICAAWRDGDTVFMVVDSILTYTNGLAGMPLREDGTFAEPAKPSPEHPSIEIGCKLFQLGSGVVACYSGAAGPAVSALVEIRSRLADGHGLMEIAGGLDLEKYGQAFQLILGRGDAAETLLYKLGSDGSRVDLYEDHVVTVIGSLPEPGKDFVRRSVLLTYGLPGVSSDPDQILASVVSQLQALGRRVNLIHEKAGGAFFGLRSSSGMVVALQEIQFVVFSKQDLARDIGIESARIGIVGDALFAWPLERAVAIYVSDVSKRSDEESFQAVDDYLENTKPPFYCLIERDVGASICIDCRNGLPSEFMTIHNDGRITLLPCLLEMIAQIPDATTPLPKEVPHRFLVQP
jgi:hypothetical protein